MKIGDVVMLKSDGPKMTVVFIGQEGNMGCPAGHVQCQWFESGKSQREIFPVEALELVTE
jgi:uncharacterized protein YodC (DUF2158 family)